MSTTRLAPKRAYAHGSARPARSVRIDQNQDQAVDDLAAALFGGNYSAALGYLVEQAMATSKLFDESGDLVPEEVERALASSERREA